MPGYKGHLVGGLIVYGVALYLLHLKVQPTALTAFEWLVFTLAGSLFPDIDVKSKGQNLSYLALFAIFIALILRGYFELVAILGVLSLIPMIVRHRGLFHRWWFIVLFAGVLSGVCMFHFTLPCRVILFDALFFVLGALSHLWLDVGFKRMFRL